MNEAETLIAEARKAARHAHAPYSRFAVGAAVLLSDGGIVTGANVENASYGLSLCAETVAIATASAAGRLADVVAVGVIGGAMVDGRATGDVPVRPCGRCRQVLNEAAQLGSRDLAVYCAGAEGDRIEHHRLSALLPHAFGPADLGLAEPTPAARVGSVITSRNTDMSDQRSNDTDTGGDASGAGYGDSGQGAGEGGGTGTEQTSPPAKEESEAHPS